MSCSNYCYIISFGHFYSFTNFKLLIWICKQRDFRSTKSQIYRSFVVGNCNCCSFCLIVITSINYRHSRKHFHHSDIFKNLMSSSIFTQCNPSMRSTNLYVLSRIGNGLSYLIIHSSGRKVSKGSCEGNFSTYS